MGVCLSYSLINVTHAECNISGIIAGVLAAAVCLSVTIIVVAIVFVLVVRKNHHRDEFDLQT